MRCEPAGPSLGRSGNLSPFADLARRFLLVGMLAVGCAGVSNALTLPDPLPSWNDGATKKSITDFVSRVTTPGSTDFVPPAQRIATFDNDGTLWCEQPIYFQVAFALERVKALAPEHPEWLATQPFKGVIENDMQAVLATGVKGILDLIGASQNGTTSDDSSNIVTDWLTHSRHPRFNRPYTDLAYQPMLELLAYLRANGFRTFIVSGGGIDFMRAWAETVYGIPPEQVVGSTGSVQFEVRPDGHPVLINLDKIDFIDDGPNKPVGINRFIGRRPIFAFGNSDGDLQMLEWTAEGRGARFMGLVHHTDAEREYAYDRQSKIGRLDKALDEATAKGWTVVDMKSDWNRIFAFAQ